MSPRQCPLYPRKRTNKRRLDLSALCQKQTLKCAAHGPRTTILLVQRLDDADVTHRAIAERLERLLVGGACIGGDSLLDAREFRDDDALFLPGLVSGGRRAAREIASAKRRDRRRRKLRISGKLLRIRNRAIDGDPVGFSASSAPCGRVRINMTSAFLLCGSQLSRANSLAHAELFSSFRYQR